MIIGNLNINCISNKLENLKLLIQGKVDILVITDTKTDSNFSLNQFEIPSYSKCYKFDRNRNGDGVFIYVSEDISNRQLKIYNTPEDMKSIFIEIILIKSKLIFCSCYHPINQSQKYFLKR